MPFLNSSKSPSILSTKIFWIAIGLLLFTFSLYIFQVNMLAKDSYILSEYQQRISDLSQENKRLEIAFFKKNSLESKKHLKEHNFVEVTKVDYIRVLEGSVAANR